MSAADPFRGIPPDPVSADPARLRGEVRTRVSDAMPQEDASALRAALDASRAELLDSRSEIDEFCRVASHDLRAPLRHITAYAGIVRELVTEQCAAAGVVVDEELGGCLDTLDQSAHRMVRMIDAMLAYAQVAHAPFDRRPLDLGALVREARGAVLRSPVAASRSIAWDIAEEWPACDGDPVLVGQLLVHLIDNAVRFSARRPVAHIAVGWRRDAAGVPEIRICDDGAGFDPARAGRLFRLFERLHRASDFDGLGTGLALSRRIVARHGGGIRVEAAPSAGCTVSFTLQPAADTPPAVLVCD
jgi:light-regulated signal transduction histidine kinase (bacteriophytochrome)